MAPIIRVSGLTKHFKGFTAVEDLSFSVGKADIYGFLGQNGAGKSTTIRMLLTLIEPSSGEIEIFGMKLSAHRKEILRRVGAVIERPDLYKYMTAYEHLVLFTRMNGLSLSSKQLMQQLEQVGLAERAKSKVNTFSQGMKQRLGIAVALVHNPDLVILDEPTNGLDPQGIADIRNLILHLSRHEGKTLLVSSHLLSEMELIANRMLIIDRGRKVVEGNVADLFDPSLTLVEVDATDPGFALEVLRRSPWANMLHSAARSDSSSIHSDPLDSADRSESAVPGPHPVSHPVILLKMARTSIPQLTADLVAARVQIQAIRPRHSLEDYFLSLTTANQHVEAFTDRTV